MLPPPMPVCCVESDLREELSMLLQIHCLSRSQDRTKEAKWRQPAVRIVYRSSTFQGIPSVTWWTVAAESL